MPVPKVVPLGGPRAGAAPTQRTDEELMLLVRAGSRDAMAVLAERYVGPLTSFCAKLTGDLGAAEDIVQEALLRLWTRRADWQPRGRVGGLLYTAARNLCRNRARDTRRRGRWLLPAAGVIAVEGLRVTAGDIDPVLSRERRRDVLRALADLPEAMREALLLRFDGEMSYEEIARVVGANESTVRSRVHFALLRMRATVGGEEADGR
jgi:RNA polymerase sigma-70 factor (ECF subfamily)